MTFSRLSMARRLFTDILWPEDTLLVLWSQMAWYTYSETTKALTGHLGLKDILHVFYGQKICYRSSMARRLFMGFLMPKKNLYTGFIRLKNRLQELKCQKAFRMPPVAKRLLWPPAGLSQVFCGQKIWHWPSFARGYFTGLLLSESILLAFFDQKDFHRFSVVKNPSQIFGDQKTFHRSSVVREPFTGFLWLEGLS